MKIDILVSMMMNPVASSVVSNQGHVGYTTALRVDTPQPPNLLLQLLCMICIHYSPSWPLLLTELVLRLQKVRAMLCASYVSCQ